MHSKLRQLMSVTLKCNVANLYMFKIQIFILKIKYIIMDIVCMHGMF